MSAQLGHCVGVELAARDPESLTAFYVRALGFSCESSGADACALRLGQSIVRLRRVGRGGRDIPVDSRSHDRWFRHIAIVVRDMRGACDHVTRHGGTLISRAPQTLPNWNPPSAGIEAVYLRDLEGHPFELISFPRGKGKPHWHEPGSDLFRGIDHTAIVVENTQRSVEFYRRHGFEAKATALNRGLEQESLSGVPGATVHVTSLPGSGEMGIELLEYLAPQDGRPYPPGSTPNDLWSGRTLIRSAVNSGSNELLDPDHHGVLTL